MAFIKDILLGAEKRKADLKLMCQELEIEPFELYQSDIKVSFEKAVNAWDIAINHTGDQLLGLHLGEQTNPSILGLVGYLMQSCPNLLEAYKSVCSFSIIASDMFTYSLSIIGMEARLVYEPCTPWIRTSEQSARQGVEQAMAGTLNVFKILAGKNIYPQRVQFAHNRRQDLPEYERVFHAPIQWDTPFNALIFTEDQLRSPVVSYDESLMGVFCELIKKRFEKIASESFEDQIKREIMTTFKGQLPSIDSMAARFNLTVRSFQRKLEGENLSYRQICHGLGRDFATSLLTDKRIKVTEVALALGYSDTRAFHRAFKQWTGKSPDQFRKEQGLN